MRGLRKIVGERRSHPLSFFATRPGFLNPDYRMTGNGMTSLRHRRGCPELAVGEMLVS
jgi:hypothetical protein